MPCTSGRSRCWGGPSWPLRLTLVGKVISQAAVIREVAVITLFPIYWCPMSAAVSVGRTFIGGIGVSRREHGSGTSVPLGRTGISIRLSRAGRSKARAKPGGETVGIQSSWATGSTVDSSTTTAAWSGSACLLWRSASWFRSPLV